MKWFRPGRPDPAPGHTAALIFAGMALGFALAAVVIIVGVGWIK